MAHQMSLAAGWKQPYQPKRPTGLTHEEFVKQVAELGVSLLQSEEQAQARKARLAYGAGARMGARGVTYYDRWLNERDEAIAFVELCSHGEENPVQLAGTTLHELGHVLAGHGAGHGKEWKQACDRLGLRRILAGGTRYQLANFDPRIREQVAALIERLNDGKPHNPELQGIFKVKPCSQGIGVRGGKSRGVGSGSRLRKYVCAHCGQILRASTDDLQATHDPDGGKFVIQLAS